jgi:hypothetical protein
MHNSGAPRGEIAKSRLQTEAPIVIARHRVGAMRRPMTGSSGRSSIPETLMMESRGRGVLDRPVKPDDDNPL